MMGKSSFVISHIFLFFSWWMLAGCQREKEEDPGPAQTITYTFEESTEGWTGGFTDYPVGWEEERLEFIFEHAALPAEVNQDGKALKISGRNLSDDLFLFVKKEISGLEPNHTYLLSVQVELASQYPEQSVGIGGSPGASVYVKAGGSSLEPRSVANGDNYRLNLDKGNQSQGGEDLVVIGTVGIPGSEFTYRLIGRDNLQQPVRVKSDAAGRLWVIIGTDSGFEGTTTLYYNTIAVTLQE